MGIVMLEEALGTAVKNLNLFVRAARGQAGSIRVIVNT
jgi:hypothetical protein